MGGGLMQLVAYGAQDIYLTGNPQITFFKVNTSAPGEDSSQMSGKYSGCIFTCFKRSKLLFETPTIFQSILTCS